VTKSNSPFSHVAAMRGLPDADRQARIAAAGLPPTDFVIVDVNTQRRTRESAIPYPVVLVDDDDHVLQLLSVKERERALQRELLAADHEAFRARTQQDQERLQERYRELAAREAAARAVAERQQRLADDMAQCFRSSATSLVTRYQSVGQPFQVSVAAFRIHPNRHGGPDTVVIFDANTTVSSTPTPTRAPSSPTRPRTAFGPRQCPTGRAPSTSSRTAVRFCATS
jgi:hypothetical protein